ncbi:MAG: transglutaminase domain-containing protein [Velocimicrobium sp.]
MLCLQKDDTDFEKTIAIYGEFNSRMKYDKNVDDTSANHALMEGTGICTSFSAAYCHLLLQAGVDAITNGGFSKKSGGHSWDIVHLEDKDYFMDTTYEVGSKGSDGKGLLYFGMSKKDREEIGGFNLDSSQYGDVNGLEAEDYVNSDDRFCVFRNCIDFELDRKHKCIVYYNKDDNNPKTFYYEK